MSSASRQNSLLVAEDWKKIYQTFREADFTSYDFETLRKSMIDYLRLYYPEDFNDFIESSEYIALIDLIAFLGQSLAFRTDINARENFLDTAERRDSILKLARLISYSPKRSLPATGLLKFTSIATSESLVDSNGVNLANLPITWNDTTNNNWLEQFTIILNATLLNSQVIGKPSNSQVINSIKTDEYTINITSGTTPVFSFDSLVAGSSMPFEAVSATSAKQPYIYEVDPKPVSKFNILARNDNQGNGSNNTGYFLFFKQGKLQSVDFTLSESVPNRVLNVGFSNINNTDVWLYDVNSSNVANNKWTQVPAIAGVNVIYNKATERNLFQVNTTASDQIDLVFGDGSFSNIPQGKYRIYFRTGNAQSYKITPDEIQDATITIPYISRSGQQQTLSIRANLNYTVSNAATGETSNEIRSKAPQQYYTQNRMITGEDYNIVPYTQFSNILKVKALNRTSSGVSRYLDVNDSSGKYSSTNIFAQDGFLYKESVLASTSFSFLTSASAQRLIQDDLTRILNSKELQHYYYETVVRQQSLNTVWTMSSLNTNGCTGYFYDPTNHNQVLQLGNSTSTQAKYIRPGAIIKFKAPTGKYFNTQNQLVTVRITGTGRTFLYASVQQVIGDGTNGGLGTFANGQGTVTMSQKVPSTAIVDEIIPVFKTTLPSTLVTSIARLVLAFNSFALNYDIATETWVIVASTNPASINDQWLINFVYDNNVGYIIQWKSTNYIFESLIETKFYFDENVKVYDSNTSTTIHDQIKVLKVNPKGPEGTGEDAPLGVDYTWYIYKNIVDIDGYENQSKVLVTFTDDNVDGIPDNPDIFETVVNTSTFVNKKWVFFKQEVGYSSFISYAPIPPGTVNTDYATQADIPVAQFTDGQVFYATGEDVYYVLGASVLTVSTEYIKMVGRGDLYFQYRHNSPGYRRIDPSPNNLIDLYMLTKAYAADYQAWIRDTTNTISEPVPPTTDQLKLEYGTLETSKAVSDSVIFNSAKFKPLFGAKAPGTLQATFKVVKNASLNISDNDIKSSVINAINTFFAIDNWDFGETFYFSELSAYLHTALAPNVSSIIIVPTTPTSMFGSLYQINAEANEIVTSSATVENVEIISAITAAQINANFAGVNNTITFGTN